jgi:hypothetical protein
MTYVLKDELSGRYLPGRYTWEEAQAEAERQILTTIRRLDEALAETGRS